MQAIDPAFWFSGKGSLPGMLESPVGIAATHDGGYVVADR
jgi:hypothetical protein